MKADESMRLVKGALCLSILIAAFALSPVKRVQAAETFRWGQDAFGISLLGADTAGKETDLYDIEEEPDIWTEESEDTTEESEDTDEESYGQEDIETEAFLADIDENNLISPESYEALDWTDLAAADVDEYLNIRAQADPDAEIVGRVYTGSVLEVEETDGEWTRISSGNAEGYVASEYLLFGTQAKAYMDEIIEYTVCITADSVRIRSEQSTDSTVIAAADEGDTLTWDVQAQTQEGWTAVIYHDKTCYISSEFTQTGILLMTAMTNEEAEEYEASDYSDSDLALLAALIFCEAGGESYAGQLAVGAVVVNRMKSSSYPDTLEGVIYQSGQFGPASSGKLARVLAAGSATSSCYQAAEEALSGVSNVGSCLHFHAGSGSGTQIGNQVFY